MEQAVNYGIISLLPIVITLALAIWTRNVLFSLFVGLFTGVLILVGGNPVVATKTLIESFLLEQMLDSYNVGIIILLVFIGGFVTLLEQSGGAEAFARSVSKFVNSQSKTQIAAWLAGILVFFSELGTPLIVGPIFSPLFNRMKISKEKLAWILDTTSSPVCILIPFIGWGVYSMGLIQTEFDALGIKNITDWTAFIKAIPFQFYAILCLIFVPIVAISKREIGQMALAEQNASKGIFSTAEEGVKAQYKDMITNTGVSPLVVIIPLVVLFGTLFGILAPQGFPIKQVPGSQFRIALITGYLYAAIAMIILMAYYKVKNIWDGINIYLRGCSKLFSCIVMLILAWSLSSVGKQIGTSEYIIAFAKGNIPAFAVPAIIFILGAIMSFATGTSWGSFAIMFPIAIPMAVSLGSPLYVTIAAVLSGGLFGDHCSPVSDTTILSATAANCTLIDHMKTQLPYALICGLISIVGYLLAGLFDNVIITLICIVLLFVIYYFLSKTIGVKIENYKEV